VRIQKGEGERRFTQRPAGEGAEKKKAKKNCDENFGPSFNGRRWSQEETTHVNSESLIHLGGKRKKGLTCQ